MGDRLKDIEMHKVDVTERKKIVFFQHASCPNGCNLMDEKVKINGMAAIKVRLKYGEQVGNLWLDPKYESYEHQSEIEVPDGAIVEFFCPHCGVSLKNQDVNCRACSAPTFSLELPEEGEITGCLRKGCFDHNLKIVSFEAMQLRIDEKFIQVIM